MSALPILLPEDLDITIAIPEGLERLNRQHILDLTPWHLMPRELALKRLHGLRQRYASKYVPFARRQDNDDLACLDPAIPGGVIVVHDFAAETTERRRQFPNFWDWFRAAVEDMISFE
jgi:hypothetical protein